MCSYQLLYQEVFEVFKETLKEWFIFIFLARKYGSLALNSSARSGCKPAPLMWRGRTWWPNAISPQLPACPPQRETLGFGGSMRLSFPPLGMLSWEAGLAPGCTRPAVLKGEGMHHGWRRSEMLKFPRVVLFQSNKKVESLTVPVYVAPCPPGSCLVLR